MPLSGFNVNLSFHFSLVDQAIPGNRGDLFVKSKVSPHSGSAALRELNLSSLSFSPPNCNKLLPHVWCVARFGSICTIKNTPPWVFFTFFKLYKCYQIAQRIIYRRNNTFSQSFIAFLKIPFSSLSFH